MLISTKRYVITTNKQNAYRFRVATAGIDWSLYYNNPIMLYMHFRATGQHEKEVKALGNVREIEIDDEGVVTGRLYFNDKYPFAVEMYEGYENGTYNMLSIGVEPIELSDDPSVMEPGQLYATITKSIAKEISCVDIGANSEAVGVALYDASGKIITLSDKSLEALTNNSQIFNMKLVTLSAPAILTLLKLGDTASETEAVSAIQNLVTLSATQGTTIEQLKSDKLAIESEKTELETKLADQATVMLTDKVESLVQGAVDDRKITKDEKDGYITLATSNYEQVEKILGAKTGSPTVNDRLKNSGDEKKDDLAKLCDKSYDELFESGELNQVKLASPDNYKRIFKAKFNREPNNV